MTGREMARGLKTAQAAIAAPDTTVLLVTLGHLAQQPTRS